MKNMFLYTDNFQTIFNFTCTRKLHKPQKLERYYGDKEDIKDINVIIYTINDNQRVQIFAYLNNAPLYDVKVPFVKNHVYEIRFSYKDLHKHSNSIHAIYPSAYDCLYPKQPIEYEQNDIIIKKQISPKLAKKRWKLLKKEKLIGKVHWDNWTKDFDVCCHACHHTESAYYEALSIPSVGYVTKVSEEGDPRFKNIKASHSKELKEHNQFIYNGILYNKIPDTNQTTIPYWTEEEYLEIAQNYYNKDLIKNRDGTINLENLESQKSDWMPFEEYWKQSCLTPEVECHYYDKETSSYVSGIDKTRNIDDYEKVVPSFWSEQAKGSVECPVCRELFNIMDSGYNWVGIRKYLKHV